MADYHRFVAYIYEYVNGKKMQNTGFAKVELRNGICRIQIHIQNVRMMDGNIQTFGIVRQPKEGKTNNPIILLIGEGQIQGSGFDRRFTVPEDPFVEESYRFEQVCGIYIRSQGGRNWMTVFDDEPIAIENLGKPEEEVAKPEEKTVKENELEKEKIKIEENKKSEKTFEQNKYEKIEETEAEDLQESQIEKAESEQTEASEIEKAEETEKSEKSESSEENINPDIPEHIKAEPEITSEEIKEEILPDETAEEMPDEILSKEVVEEISEKASMKDISEEIPEETFPKEVSEKASQAIQDELLQKERSKETDEEISQKETEEESGSESRIKSAEAENKCKGCEPGTDTRWNRATARYVHFQPVQDDAIEDAIRIQPSDLKILWQKGMRQGSNSFLMHGFYQHQHLMIGKNREGGYVLGVPGFYGEKNMAEMFGFPEFRKARAERRPEITEQTFGYWCKDLY